MTFILADAWLITMNEQRDILEKASVCVEKDRIAAIGTRQDLERRFPTAEVIDCAGKIVMPGMVNTHTHLFQTLLKGLGDDMVLKKWFTCMTGPSAVHLLPEDAHAGAMHGCVESIRSGVTTLVDFMYVHTRPGMIKAVLEAFEETGMRGFVCRGFVSFGEEYGVPRELIEEPEHAIGDAREQMRRYNKRGGPSRRPLPRPKFTHNDTSGAPFDFFAKTQRKLTLLFFGYTHCDDVCPLQMQMIAQALKKMPRDVADRFSVVFVTTDPDRDSPAVLRAWLDHFDKRFIGLTGSQSAVDAAEIAANLPPAKKSAVRPNGDYEVGHSSFIFTYTKDNLAHVVYPEGVQQEDFIHDLPLLAEETWAHH